VKRPPLGGGKLWLIVSPAIALASVGACADENLPLAEGDGGVLESEAGVDATADVIEPPDADASPDQVSFPDAPDANDGTPGMLGLSGAISPIHDPTLIWSGTKYHLFSTGPGLPRFESTDLHHWTAAGKVFDEKPAWVTTTNPAEPDTLWAPDISFFGGQYHLYYSASSFGSNVSCIGHATSSSLDPPTWHDRGSVICSSSSDDWNAIDPAAHVDSDGDVWLAFGSFWSGIKLTRLASDGSRLGSGLISLSTRANTAVEAPYIVRHGEYYYLFESVDSCCKGAASTYKMMVGRATNITGPYVDKAGTPLLSGGGTLLVESGERWKGPGHNTILRTPAGDWYNVYHSYDATRGGWPTLRIAELKWGPDGWPTSAGP